MHRSLYLGQDLLADLSFLKDVNIDSIFVDSSALSKEAISQIRNNSSCRVYSVVSCFNKVEPASAEHLALGYNEDTQSLEPLKGLCPTNPVEVSQIHTKIDSTLQLDINGIWLSGLHYPVDCTIVKDSYIDSCFCNDCIQKFIKYVGDDFEYSTLEELYLLIDGSYYQEWLDFKAENIVKIVKYAKSALSDTKADAKLGYFTLPWDESEHRAGLQRVAAQERTKITPLVDITSPMLLYKAMDKQLEWVHEKVEYFWNIGAAFLPLVDTSDNPTQNEVASIINAASTEPSIGCIVQTTRENLPLLTQYLSK